MSFRLPGILSHAADIVASGECGEDGDNLTWTLDSEGTLAISGEGDMWDYYDEPPYPYLETITRVILKDGVTSIGNWAFAYCTSLTSITIPHSVTSIGVLAFEYCTSLTSITIPDSVTSIGDGAFSNCTSLTSITIPDSVTSIEATAFHRCTSLTSITIPDSVTIIGERTFYECTSLTSITIPDSVTIIGKRAFYECTSLTSITIPDSVTSIGESAFEYCYGLTDITIPDSVTSIGSYAFYSCTSLTDITILNPDCEISGDNSTICNEDDCGCLFTGTIHGYTGSSAEKYAKDYSQVFVPLSEAPEKSDDIILTFEGKQYSMIKDYSPEWFAQNTSGRLYFPNLAYTEMLLAGSAYNGTEIVKNLKALGFENINETDTGYENTESFCMKNYVFDRDENNKLCDTTIKHIEKMNPNSVGYTIAKKKLDNGEDLVLVTIRGTITYDSILSDALKPGTEWNSDFIPALEALIYPDGIHTGFSVPATAVYNDIKAMYGGIIKTDNVNYVVTGHSRGAGTANLVEKWLIDDGVPQGNMFCYNFACPDVDQKFELEFNPIDIKHGGKKYDCIYNFGVAGDPVTIVPGLIGNILGIKTLDGLTTVWGKYGQTKWFSKTGLARMVSWDCNSVSTSQKIMSEWYLDSLHGQKENPGFSIRDLHSSLWEQPSSL